MSDAPTNPMDVGSQSMTQRSWLSGQREDCELGLKYSPYLSSSTETCAPLACSQVEFAPKKSTRKFHHCAHQTQRTGSIPGSSTCRQVRSQARRDRKRAAS